MTEWQRLRVTDHNSVRWLEFHRPEKKNAIDVQTAEEIWQVLADAEGDETVHAVVVSGAGDTFCAGVDVSVFLDIAGLDSDSKEKLQPLSTIDQALLGFSKPLIAAVHGKVVGMGVTLLPFFDLVYASTDATFTTPFVNLGLVLEYSSSYHLPRLIGRQRTNELILRAKPIDAATAVEWGLVTRSFEPEALRQEVTAIVSDIAARPAGAVAACKALIRAGEGSSINEADTNERQELAQRYGSPENVAAVKAFLASRKRAK